VTIQEKELLKNAHSFKTPKTGLWTRRDTETGRFLDVKTSSPEKFKGIKKEKEIMEEKFVQKALVLDAENSIWKIKVEKLCELISDHPYRSEIYKIFDIENIKNEIISIDNIDTLFNRVTYFNKNHKRQNILAHSKYVNVFQSEKAVGLYGFFKYIQRKLLLFVMAQY
jgi:hypothetical protein